MARVVPRLVVVPELIQDAALREGHGAAVLADVQRFGVEDEFVRPWDARDVLVVDADDGVVLVWGRQASDVGHNGSEVDVLVSWFVLVWHQGWKGCDGHGCGLVSWMCFFVCSSGFGVSCEVFLCLCWMSVLVAQDFFESSMVSRPVHCTIVVVFVVW